MRFLATILSLYILVLIAIPCGDLPSDNSAHQIEHLQHANEQHYNDDVDHCSPFCDCICCVSAIAHSFDSQNFTCYYFSYIELTNYLSTDITFGHSSIWQPPKA